LPFELRRYETTTRVMTGPDCYRKSRKTMHSSRLDKAIKLKLFAHLYRMKDKWLVKTVVLEMVVGNRDVCR